MKIVSVVGARPNFMKIAPIYRAINIKRKVLNVEIEHLICHTGQHYDERMSKIFFEELELPKPDFYLGIGSGSHTEQTARIMMEFEKVLLEVKPDLVIVVGDVNSTIACSLTAVKLGIKVAHVEAGLRSFDRSMPEEINRILTDSISDYLFVTEQSGLVNLKREGVDEKKIHFVGHVMIDSLVYFLSKAEKSKILEFYKLIKNKYILVTMHRPSNVDNEDRLEELISLLNRLAEKTQIIFPVHPRTSKNLEKFKLNSKLSSNLIITDPIGYLDFIWIMRNASLILTDSGGIQEESTFLGIQCITLRKTTERPITVDVGTNQLVGDDFASAEKLADSIISGKIKIGKIPDLWDGKSSERIVEILIKEFT